MTVRLFGIIYMRAAWSSVASAQQVVGGLMGSPGVRIDLGDGKKFVFCSYHPERVVEALRSRHVRIIDSGAKPPKVWLGS